MLRYGVYCALLLQGFCQALFSQSVKNFRELSRPEKCWVITHPFIAKKTFRITKRVLVVCDSLKKDSVLDGDMNGGQLDAFRHAFWMCMLTQHISYTKAYRLGLAHEKGNKIAFRKGQLEDNARPDSMSSVMDLINNQVGIELGLRNKGKKLTESDLVTVVKDRVLNGSMVMVLKRKTGECVTCDGEVIDLHQYKGQWDVPKCLVSTDTVRW